MVALSEDQAMLALEQIMSEGRVGEAGQTVVIEEFLEGEEASFICICDGKTAIPFASSQDHKARDEGDLGPNTGGMGAYSPAPVVTPEIHRAVMSPSTAVIRRSSARPRCWGATAIRTSSSFTAACGTRVRTNCASCSSSARRAR